MQQAEAAAAASKLAKAEGKLRALRAEGLPKVCPCGCALSHRQWQAPKVCLCVSWYDDPHGHVLHDRCYPRFGSVCLVEKQALNGGAALGWRCSMCGCAAVAQLQLLGGRWR